MIRLNDESGDSTPYYFSTRYVAKQLNHPRVNGNIKLRRFLLENGIFDQNGICKKYRNKGLFYERPLGYTTSSGYDFSLKVTREGIEFIKKLVKEKLGSN